MKNDILLDENGYKEYLDLKKSLEKTKIDLLEKTDRYNINEQLLRKIASLNNEIERINSILNTAKLITKHDNKDLLDIGDIVKIKLYFEEGIEEDTYELVAGSNDYSSTIIKLSINSPLGKALYKRKVNDEVYYTYDNNKVRVQILEKVNVKKKELK